MKKPKKLLKTIQFTVIISIVAVLVLSQLFYFMQQPQGKSASNPSPTPNDQADQSTTAQSQNFLPQDNINTFYKWYLAYPGQIFTDKGYQNNPFISTNYAKQLDALVAANQTTNPDPLTCSAQKPGQINLGEMTFQGSRATLKATTDISTQPFTIETIKNGNTWQIDSVVCNK